MAGCAARAIAIRARGTRLAERSAPVQNARKSGAVEGDDEADATGGEVQGRRVGRGCRVGHGRLRHRLLDRSDREPGDEVRWNRRKTIDGGTAAMTVPAAITFHDETNWPCSAAAPG